MKTKKKPIKNGLFNIILCYFFFLETFLFALRFLAGRLAAFLLVFLTFFTPDFLAATLFLRLTTFFAFFILPRGMTVLLIAISTKLV